jgi:hypothetical protein
MKLAETEVGRQKLMRWMISIRIERSRRESCLTVVKEVLSSG